VHCSEKKLMLTISETIRKVRHVRKKLLARIVSPRWEIPHHYHMTCCEHILGHTQPHVMDVGEMLPGHLRLFSHARRTTLFTKALIYSLARAKAERKNASEKIKEVYRELRRTRGELKEIDRAMASTQDKSHLLEGGAGNDAKRTLMQAQQKMRRGRGAIELASRARQNPRQRYLASLHLPVSEIQHKIKDELQKQKSGEEAEEREWKQMEHLLEELERTTSQRRQLPSDIEFIGGTRAPVLGVGAMPHLFLDTSHEALNDEN